MAARYVITTRDLTVKFYNQSYKINDVAKSVWLGSNISKDRCTEIADGLQELVDRGRYGQGYQEKTRGRVRAIVFDVEDMEANLINDNAQLRDKIHDLEAEVMQLMYNGIGRI